MLRRLALAIALITGSAQAGDLDYRDVTGSEDAERSDDLQGLPVAEDGTIQGWSLVRLVLPDLEDGIGETAWFVGPPSRTARGSAWTLGSLVGRALVDADGAALGIVRGTLVRLEDGRVLALEVDVGPPAGPACTVAVPWAMVAQDGAVLRTRADAAWIQTAPATGSTGVRELGE